MIKKILIFSLLSLCCGCGWIESRTVEYKFERSNEETEKIEVKSDLPANFETDLAVSPHIKNNWYKYENKLLQFSLYHPKDLRVIEKNPFVDLVEIDYKKINDFLYEMSKDAGEFSGYRIQINILTNPEKIAIEDWYQDFYKQQQRKNRNKPLPLPKSGEMTKINNLSAYKIQVANNSHEERRYFIKNDSIIYYITIINRANVEKESEENENQINEILNTFSIIEK
ncbi:MAG: hypothetical protein GF335_00695 [Candidatus Moranbacteria bacterium]|nr:hypothetical protein [Candidatus Moranbacteria bacterium]